MAIETSVSDRKYKNQHVTHRTAGVKQRLGRQQTSEHACIFCGGSWLMSMLRPLHESVNISHNTEKQCLHRKTIPERV